MDITTPSPKPKSTFVASVSTQYASARRYGKSPCRMAAQALQFCMLLMLFRSQLQAQDWKKHSIDSRGKGADGVRLLDVNGDGRLDIACGWEEARETRVYLHPGSQQVRGSWPTVTVGPAGPVEDAVFCDLDSDGACDVISASEDREIRIHWAPTSASEWLNPNAWTTVKLPAASGLQNWMFTIPAQLDGNHGPDLIAAGKGTDVVWFEAPEYPRHLNEWKRHRIHSRGGWTMGMMLADVNHDGHNDLLLGIRRTNPGVRWLRNPGPGPGLRDLWEAVPLDPQHRSAGFVEFSDLDGDGFPDVVSPMMERKELQIFRGLDRTGRNWQNITLPLPTERNKGIAAGDINLDGQIDLVVAHELGGAAWLEWTGSLDSGQWSRHSIGSGGKLDDVTLTDLDADGDLDMLTTDERGLQVIWFENPQRE